LTSGSVLVAGRFARDRLTAATLQPGAAGRL